MQTVDFQFLSDLLKKRSGLALTDDKAYLIESRLAPIARQYNCADLPGLVQLVRTTMKETILNEITEAMTTNESLFFRDGKPFEYLRQTLLPAFKAMAGKGSLRLWSAACSTGQEPYSAAICLQEESEKMPGWRYEIVATDLASKVVEKAKEGIYSQFEVQRGLPIHMLIKYFKQAPSGMWQIKDAVRNMISYRTQNLLENLSALGKFDIIFCRNVLFYFDEITRGQVIEKFSRVLVPGGYLFLGSTETIIDTKQFFTSIDQCRGLYRLK